jgi:acyl-CoA thioesterase II
MHCYFLRPGDPDTSLLFVVDRVRDGRTYVTRTVKGVQGGKDIFTAMVSFARHDEPAPVEHGTAMPTDAPDPESLPDEAARLTAILADPRLPPQYHKIIRRHMESSGPMDMRCVGMCGA